MMTVPRRLTTVESLQAAKADLMENGWVQEYYRNEEKHCILGAIAFVNYISGADAEDTPESHLLRELSGVDNTCHNIAWWNDRPGRTFAEVMDLFDRAILEAKELEAGQ